MKRILCLYISAVLIIGTLTACGGSSGSAPMSAEAGAPAAEASPAPSYDAYHDDYEYPNEAEAGSAMPLPLLTPSGADGKKIVYTVTLWLQTTGFDAGTRTLLNTVVDMGGYVQSAYINGRDLRNPDIERDATYTFRIPSENLSEFLVVMEDNYTLWRLEQESQDITAKSNQTDTRLNDLLEQEKRLLEDIAAATESREKLSLERQLADVQASISGLDASRTSMDNAVIYSTVTIRLFEVILYEPEAERQVSFAERLGLTVNNSLNWFVAFCQGFLLVLIALAPVIVILAVIAAIVLLVMRLVRRRGGRIKKTLTGDGDVLPGGRDDEEDGGTSL